MLLLLYGTRQAMSAAFGIPGDATVMTGRRSRDWEAAQAADGATALKHARVATLAALGLLIATTIVAVAGAKGRPLPRSVRAR